jgi:hypothetical protein
MLPAAQRLADDFDDAGQLQGSGRQLADRRSASCIETVGPLSRTEVQRKKPVPLAGNWLFHALQLRSYYAGLLSAEDDG